jgi:hypothetical protein
VRQIDSSENNTHPTIQSSLLAPKMKLKLKGRRFESTESIQTEWQNVMKTLTQSDFHHSFRSVNPAGIAMLTQKGTTSKEMEENKTTDK